MGPLHFWACAESDEPQLATRHASLVKIRAVDEQLLGAVLLQLLHLAAGGGPSGAAGSSAAAGAAGRAQNTAASGAVLSPERLRALVCPQLVAFLDLRLQRSAALGTVALGVLYHALQRAAPDTFGPAWDQPVRLGALVVHRESMAAT